MRCRLSAVASLILASLAFLAPARGLFAEEAPAIPEGLDPDMAALARISGLFDVEDPTSLYEFGINDSEVEFILDGSWEVALTSALAIDFSSGETVYGYTPPVFTQAVDLLSWVFLDRTWYFEASFAEQFAKNTVAAGYVGNDETPVKHVRVGNSKIIFPSGYPFIAVGGGTAIAPGVMGTFAGERWNADAVVRYDASSQKSLVLSGMNEINDSLVSVAKPARGKWFVLPDAPVTGSVTVYVETAGGPIKDDAGRKWRELDPAEFTVTGLSGTVELDAAATGAVAIRYGDGSYPGRDDFVSDADDYFRSVGTTMKDYVGSREYLVTLEGKPALLVRERGKFSPFEALMRYPVEGTDFELVYSESGVRLKSYSVVPYDKGYAEILPRGEEGSVRSPEYRYPLARKFPTLYFPSTGGVQTDTDLSVRARSYNPVTTISLGEDVIAGTILVTRNGVPDAAFAFDESAGTLELERMPSVGETIRITWQKTDGTARNGTLTVAGGFSYRPIDSLEFTVANALRWNTASDSYTDASDGSPGSWTVSTGGTWKGKSLGVSSSFAFDVSMPDTTGYYRVLGMDQKARTLYPDRDWYKRPSPKIDPFVGGPHGALERTTLDGESYVEPDGYESSSMPTVDDSSVSGDALSLRANLFSPESWTGANISTGSSGELDLSTAKEFSIALKATGDASLYELFLQLGVDSESDREDADSVRTWKIDPPSEESRWTVRTVTLTADDRRAIAGGNDARLIVRPKASANAAPGHPVAVSLRSGPVEIVESGFGSSSGDIESVERREPLDIEKPLTSVAGDLIDRFNAGTNTILELTVRNKIPGAQVSAERTVPIMPLRSYRCLSFFMLVPAGYPAGSTITVTLDEPTGDGFRPSCSLEIHPETLAANAWHVITVDLDGRKALVDGDSVDATVARVATLRTNGAPTRVSIAFAGLPVPPDDAPWRALFDEFYLEEAVPSRTVRNETTVSWKRDGPLASAFGIPLVSDVALSATSLTSSTARDDGAFSEPSLGGTAEAAFKLHRSSFSGSIRASRETEGILENESHEVSVPLLFLTAAETYSTDLVAGSFSRADSLSLRGPLAASLSLEAAQSGISLDRKSLASLEPAFPKTPIGSFKVSAQSAFTQKGDSPLGDVAFEKWQTVWKDSFPPLLSFGERDALSRGGDTTVSLGWQSDDLALAGIRLDGNAKSAYAASSTVTSLAALSFRLSVPLDFDAFTLEPSWERISSGKTPVERGGTWITDTEIVGGSFSRMHWLFDTPPVKDLFDGSIPRAIDGNDEWSNAFSNAYSLEWKRPSPGFVSDLWIPSSVTASVKRETAVDASADNVRDIWTAPVTAGFSALNMFGARGAVSVFTWYDEDEIAQLYSWTPKWGSGFFVWSADVWHSVTILFAGSGSISAENALHYDSDGISGTGEQFRDAVRLVWKRAGVRSPLADPIARLSRMAVTFKREDALTYSHSAAETATESATALDHALIAAIGKNAEAKFTAGTGFTVTNGELRRMDFRLGISGKLSY